MRVLNIVFLILTLSFSSIGCSIGKNDIFIVPKNYTGYVIIIYGQKGGDKPIYEGKKRVFNIPSSGILKTQFDGNYEWKTLPEFYYNQIAPENQIRYILDPNKIPLDSVVAYGGTSATANKDLAGKDVIRYSIYYIGNNGQIDSAYEKAENLDILKFAE